MAQRGIELDTESIKNSMQTERCVFKHTVNHIGKVIYDYNDEITDKRIEKLFCSVFEYFKKSCNSLNTYTEPDEEVFEHFVLGTTLVKHRGFSEENEVRIVVSPRPPNDSDSDDRILKPSKRILNKRRDGREVRYLELFGDAPLTITRVIIGPSRFQNLNYQIISELVKKNPHVKVEKSQIPFTG